MLAFIFFLPLLIQLVSGQLNFDDVSTDVLALNMPQIQSLDVKCDRDAMNVKVVFDRPYDGIIFSKGHYSDTACRYVVEKSGQSEYQFTVPMSGCGTQAADDSGAEEKMAYYNTIIFQMDPLVQEIWDMARRLSCSFDTNIAKTITFLPFSVGMLDVQELSFGSDHVDCWMELQVGEGPFSQPITTILEIGSRMTMAVYIKDDDGTYDIGVRECYAYDSQDFENLATNQLQLTDADGCPLKSKLMQKFYRTRATRNSGASMIAYSYIHAFKFPDKMEIYMTCDVQICKDSCNNKCSPEVTQGSEREEVVVPSPNPRPAVGPERPRLTPRPIQSSPILGPRSETFRPAVPRPQPAPRPQQTPRPIAAIPRPQPIPQPVSPIFRPQPVSPILRPQPVSPILRPRPAPLPVVPILRPQPISRPVAPVPRPQQAPPQLPKIKPAEPLAPRSETGGDHIGQNSRYHAFHRHLYDQNFGRRVRREVKDTETRVRFFKAIYVANKDDLPNAEKERQSMINLSKKSATKTPVCYSFAVFAVGVIALSLALISALVAIVIFSRRSILIAKSSN